MLPGPRKGVENEFDSNSLELDENKQKWSSPTENDLRGCPQICVGQFFSGGRRSDCHGRDVRLQGTFSAAPLNM